MKTVLITGGTGGIGQGVAASFLKRGWAVVATGATTREVDAAPKAAGLLNTVLDVTDQDAIDALVGGLDSLDALVNAAGIIRRGNEYDIEIFRQVIEVNLTGTMRMCLACKPLLAAAQGSIINLASMLSTFGGPLVPAYSASKGGIAQLTKSLAVAWAADGIRVNAVAPGWIATEMTAALRTDPVRTEAILGRTPMARWGQGAEVGALVAWLASPEASFVTGAIYPIDGGYSAV
jgi:NAD(P)-dependent dehydrogenase (short-subunit alcohol dehydrogenase family)